MNQCSKQLILFWIDKINDFLRKNEFKIDPLPSLELAGDDI